MAGDDQLVPAEDLFTDEDPSSDDSFYADDVQAAAIADNNLDPDTLIEDDDLPVTSGELEIGDLDDDDMIGLGDEHSYDEEDTPAGDNVLG